MGRELTYDGGYFSIYSTVSMGYITDKKDNLKTPEDVAKWMVKEAKESDKAYKEKHGDKYYNEIYDTWLNEAQDVMWGMKPGVEIAGELNTKTGKMKEYNNPVRLTPKLQKLKDNQSTSNSGPKKYILNINGKKKSLTYEEIERELKKGDKVTLKGHGGNKYVVIGFAMDMGSKIPYFAPIGKKTWEISCNGTYIKDLWH